MGDDDGVVRKMKTAKRRAVQTMLESVGSAERETDTEFDAMRKSFERMVAELDPLGAGLSTHLSGAHRFFENAAKLSGVVSARRPRSDQSMLSDAHFREALEGGAQRWAYLNSTVRRSMNAVLVQRALDPLRGFVGGTAKEVAKSCAARDGALTDVNAYVRRNDAGKLAAARDKCEKATAAARTDVVRAKIARDAVLADTVAALLCTQAELFSVAADYVDEVTDVLHTHVPDTIDAMRREIRELIDKGGPELVVEKKGVLRTALDLTTGKKTIGEVRAEKKEQEERERMRQEAYQPVKEDSDDGAAAGEPSDMIPKLGLAVEEDYKARGIERRATDASDDAT